MIGGKTVVGRLGPWLALAAIVLTGMAWPLTAQAEPAAQAALTPTPLRPAASPQPTPGSDDRLLQLQLRKLESERRLADAQTDRARQESDIDAQVWRAPAAAIASFGPTLVGLGALYLLARALQHWLPPRPAVVEPDLEMDEDEDDL